MDLLGEGGAKRLQIKGGGGVGGVAPNPGPLVSVVIPRKQECWECGRDDKTTFPPPPQHVGAGSCDRGLGALR